MTATAFKTVKLGTLDHDPVALEGTEGRRIKAIDDLKASIPVHGLINSLKVRVAADASRYLVTAGNRRLATLRWLRDHGGAIRGVPVTDDLDVPVILTEEGDDDAREISVAENMQRLPPTVVEEFKAFARMAEQSSVGEVAAHFGVTEQRVRQRLKLAALHPVVVTALDKGLITLQAAEAFTVEPDPARQEKYFKAAKGDQWKLSPNRIRDAFTDELISDAHWLAAVVGKEAYVAAGGQLITDEFGGDSYWANREVIDRLLPEAWERQKQAWLDEGWGHVTSLDDYGGIDALQRADRHYGTWGPGGYTWDDAEKAETGVVFFADGSRRPAFGIFPAGVKRKGKAGSTQKAPDATLLYPGRDVEGLLSEAIGEAVRSAALADPLVGLRLLVAQLHYQMRCPDARNYGSYPPDTLAIGVEAGFADDEDEDGEIRADAPELPQGRTLETVVEWAAGQDQATLVAYLGELVANALQVGASARATALALATPAGFPFDLAAYVAAASKPLLSEALRDMGEAKPKGGREALQARVLALAAETGWLPPQVRTPSYAGPAVITTPEPEAAGTDDDEDDEELVEDELADGEHLEAAE